MDLPERTVVDVACVDVIDTFIDRYHQCETQSALTEARLAQIGERVAALERRLLVLEQQGEEKR